MEDDDETPPPSPAAAPSPPPLTLPLPIHPPSSRSEAATAVLIDRGNLKQHHWKDVADTVAAREGRRTKTDVQCKNMYKTERTRVAAIAGPSKIPVGVSSSHRKRSKNPPAVDSEPENSADSSDGLPPVRKRKLPTINSGNSLSELTQAIWKDVADTVAARESRRTKTDVKCKNLDTVKKNYKAKRARVAAAAGPSKIPVGVSSSHRKRSKNPPAVDSEPENSADSSDGLPPVRKRKPPTINPGNSLNVLTQAILKFSEAYEHTETAKMQQLVEMEKERMKFQKDMELQWMQNFMKMQLEISQLENKKIETNNADNKNNSDSKN